MDKKNAGAKKENSITIIRKKRMKKQTNMNE